MLQFIQYYGRYQTLRGNLGAMPALGRVLVAVAALPGLVLIAAALLLLAVGVAVLALLTVPVYRLIQAVRSAFRRPSHAEAAGFDVSEVEDAPEVRVATRRQVDVRIIE